ncbi:D-lactate dehydrogenase [Escovopsis weberi]|uniref:D-lactate dehydrogenase n=1 Tax=Escovopsis weberi TaxID=150374 RepID=A0A0M8N1J8_ESCWE|nr:D-lactate dehydrogenase [Escovopsis weberi]
MKLAVFSTKPYDQAHLTAALERLQLDPAAATVAPESIAITYHALPLTPETAPLAAGCAAVCVFVNDDLTSPRLLALLASLGVRLVLLRSAGYNNVDLPAAAAAGIAVANVPAYSPHAVAEFALALVMALNRKTHRAYNRSREGNFALDGLMGHTLHGKTVGLIGTGRIGLAMARIMRGLGCAVLACDPLRSQELLDIGGKYRALDELLAASDVVSLHCPLQPGTRHIVNDATLAAMKPGALLVNTSRGGLVDTKAVIRALKSESLGGVALDVYEGEAPLFYDDHSGQIIRDDVLMRLMTFHNVIVTGHQAFFTDEALTEIADSTLRNLCQFARDGTCANSLMGPDKPADLNSLPVRNV